MTGRSITVGAAIMSLALFAVPASGAAQTITDYRCADGTRFIVGFYPQDKRAFLQIDGGEAVLAPKFGLSGVRYSGGGVTLTITKAGQTLIRHARRPATTCEPI